MPNKGSLIRTCVDAFQNMVEFFSKRWLATLLTTFFLIVVALICLFIYFLYLNLDRGIQLLEKGYSSPSQLQVGLEHSVIANMNIDKELTSLLLTSRYAASSAFFKFHNSTTDLQGKHDYYYSGVNEVSRDPNEHFLSGVQTVPVAKLGQYMVPLIERQCQFVYTDKIEFNAWFKTKLEAAGIGVIAMCPVYNNINGHLLGFVELIYKSGLPPVRTQEDISRCLRLSARAISEIITDDDPSKN